MAELDRRWWIRVILRADVVDLDIVAAQQGRRVTAATAVSSYVRGGFRTGFVINPLFCEPTVSRQLSDADRVPALYAYLVNDRSALDVSPNWDARRYAENHPESLVDLAGPLGHAWRRARRDGSIALGVGDRAREVPWSDILRAAADSLAPGGDFSIRRGDLRDDEGALVSSISPDEGDFDLALTAAAQTHHLRLAFILESPSAHVRIHTRLLTLWAPVTRIIATTPSTKAPRPTELVPNASTIVVRGPHALASAEVLDALAQAAVDRRVAPMWIAPDGTIASAGVVYANGRRHHLLSNHPVEDAAALGLEIEVAESGGRTAAWPTNLGPHGPATTLRSLRVTAPLEPLLPESVDAPDTDVDAILAPAGFARVVPGHGRNGLGLRRTRSTVRWAIKTAAPAGAAGEAWGDTHFARGLASSLRSLGDDVAIDALPAAHRATSVFDDVTLVLRGPQRIAPPAGSFSILWIISHPDEITADELADFDLVYAASEPWARKATTRFGVAVHPLLQCTDSELFRPRSLERTEEIVFVGTARGIARPSVTIPIEAGVPVRVYGPDWRGFIPGAAIAATGIPNSALAARYESARVVLNDHWPAMQREGFISNRLYDVVASGGRAISDEVEGLVNLFGGAVRVYRSGEELVDMLTGDIDSLFPDDAAVAQLAERVRAHDSFDARALTLRDAAAAARR